MTIDTLIHTAEVSIASCASFVLALLISRLSLQVLFRSLLSGSDSARAQTPGPSD